MLKYNLIEAALNEAGFKLLRDIFPRNTGQGDAKYEKYQIWLHPQHTWKWVVVQILCDNDAGMYFLDSSTDPRKALRQFIEASAPLTVKAVHENVALPMKYTAQAETGDIYSELSVTIEKHGATIADILIGVEKQMDDTYQSRVLVTAGGDITEHRVAVYPERKADDPGYVDKTW